MTGTLVACAMAGRSAPLPVRLAAAADAGFGAVGVSVTQCADASREGTNLAGLRRLGDGRGIGFFEAEMVELDWTADTKSTRRSIEQLKEVIGVLGVRQFNAVHFGAALATDEYADAIRSLAGELREVGAGVALEFIPFSTIRTLQESLAIIEAVGSADVGLVLDCWHILRSGVTPEQVTHIPSGAIRSVQMCDASAVPMTPMKAEARQARLLPGRQAGAIVSAVGSIAQSTHVVYSVEIWSDMLEQLPIDVAMREMHRAAAACVGRVNR